MGKKKVVDARFAKSKEYRAVINQIADEAKCPFCPDNFRYHKKPILKRLGGWFITPSTWTYKNSKHHFLIIGKSHKEKLTELTQTDWKSITTLASFVIKKYKLAGGAIAMRFGETAYTGATVCHLHMHLIVPEIKSGKRIAKTVTFPIG